MIDGQVTVESKQQNGVGLQVLDDGPQSFSDLAQNVIETGILKRRTVVANEANEEQTKQKAAEIGVMSIEKVLLLHILEQNDGQKVEGINENAQYSDTLVQVAQNAQDYVVIVFIRDGTMQLGAIAPATATTSTGAVQTRAV